MFGSKRRCNDQVPKHGTRRSISQRVPHHNLPFFHVNIRKANTGRNPHTCWLSHSHVKCIIKSGSIMNVYSVPDAEMIISYQPGQTRVIFAFLTLKTFSSLPPPLEFRFNFILSAFLLVVASTPFLTETKRGCFCGCRTGGTLQHSASFSPAANRRRATDFKRMSLPQITITPMLRTTIL